MRSVQDLIKVNYGNPSRRARSWFSIGFFALALCVFSWGLGYKLSLYASPQSNAHLFPQAKLLSKNERIFRGQSPLTDNSVPPWPAAPVILPLLGILQFAALLLKASTFRLWTLETKTCWHHRRRSRLNTSFPRPPPSHRLILRP